MFLLRKDREEQKYIYLERVLHDVNREFIALNEDEKQRNSVILNQVLKQIIEKMKKKSGLFTKMYRKEFYGGSYYDNLKVGKPDEYDLDLLLDLPKFAEPTLQPSDIPGYVEIQLTNVTGFLKQLYADEFPDFARKLLDEDHYLSTNKVLKWIESVLTLAVNEFPPLSANYPYVKQISTWHGTFHFTVHKQGPAFTLKLIGKVNSVPVKIDIDLVPCFVFGSQKWPKFPYRQNPASRKPEFFVVPKKPAESGYRDISTYWRLSFQEQEGAIISNFQNLKPVLRLIKMLIKYQQYIERGEIPYFWCRENNLISRVHPNTCFNVANRLQSIINEVERNRDDPTRITSYLTRGRVIAQSADFWSDIEDLPENRPENDSWCAIM